MTPPLRMFKTTAALIAVAFALVSAVGSGPTPAAAQGSCHVWAYYMGFWTSAGAWEHQGGILTDRPSRGFYSTGDPGTVGAQMDEARSAGIEAFVVDWWGPGDAGTTGALNNALDRAAERGFQVAASVDSFGGQNNAGRDAMTAALRYLVSDRVHHPAYLRYNGKPVIFFAFQQNAGISAGEWQAIRSEIDPSHDTIWVAEGTKYCPLCGSTMDGMYAFNMAWSDGKPHMYTRDRDVVNESGGWFYVPTVHPGWDESRVAARDGRSNPTSVRDRAGGQFMRSLWAGAAATGTDVRMIVSWNEFIENSHIEPSANYGDTYLGVTRDLISGGCGGGGAAAPSGDAAPVGAAASGTAADGTGTSSGDAEVEVSGAELVAEGDARQVIQFNPGASLQMRILADGFVPNSGEFDVAVGTDTWRGQRSEHLGTGEVRVYYAPRNNWTGVQFAVRGRTEGNADEEALIAAAEAAQLIQFNPGASLQKRIFADGFVPNSPEFRAAISGRELAAQRAEHLGSGEVRVYYASVESVGNVTWVAR